MFRLGLTRKCGKMKHFNEVCVYENTRYQDSRREMFWKRKDGVGSGGVFSARTAMQDVLSQER